MATTAAAALSWLTLSARRPCSSTETKRLREVGTRAAPADAPLLTLHMWCFPEDKKQRQERRVTQTDIIYYENAPAYFYDVNFLQNASL